MGAVGRRVMSRKNNPTPHTSLLSIGPRPTTKEIKGHVHAWRMVLEGFRICGECGQGQVDVRRYPGMVQTIAEASRRLLKGIQ